MKKTKLFTCLLLITALFAAVLSACSGFTAERGDEFPGFTTYRDIPGVNQDDIKAVEALKQKYSSFVYGMTPTTEAFADNNGELRGFAALMCEWLTELFDIEFVLEHHTWNGLLDGLQSGDIHFTSDLAHNEERIKTYYMTQPFTLNPLRFYRLEDSVPLSEIKEMRKPRYAILGGTITIDVVTEHMGEDFMLVIANEYDHAYELLLSGEADAFISENTVESFFDSYIDIPVVISDFFPLLYTSNSLTTRTEELKPIITIFDKALKAGADQYVRKLCKDGEIEYTRHKFLAKLTDEERNYIENNPVINIGAQYYNYPIDFYNEHEGEWQGIIFDILDDVTAVTGMSFEVTTDIFIEWSDLIDVLERGEVSLVPQMGRTASREGRFIWPETVIMQEQYILISKKELPNLRMKDIFGFNVALLKDYARTAAFHQMFPKHPNAYEYENHTAAFAALESGEADLLMGNMVQLLALTNYEERYGYKANVIFDTVLDISPGFNKDETVLVSIIDKALELIDYQRIVDHWMRVSFDYQARILRAQRPWIVGMAASSVCVFVLVLVLFVRSRRSGKLLEKLVTKRTNELELETSKLKAIFDSIPDIVFCKDLNSKYTQYNKVMTDFFGTEENFCIGKGDVDGLGLPVETAEQFIEQDKIIKSERRKINNEVWVLNSKGQKHLLEIFKAPIIQNGEVTGIIGIARDITRHREIEQEALSASQAKSAFLATMSHEIRTPMNGIMGFAELALSCDEVPPRVNDYLRKIKDGTKWLLNIINDILDISKIESGKMELENVHFDLSEIIARCQSVILPSVKDEGLEMSLYAEPVHGRKLPGDPVRLYQTLLNLLSNAVKFTTEGKVKLSALVKSTAENTATIYFEVRDSGIGMTPEQVAKIFDPFMQADSSTTRNYGGTGLGLAITKNIIELMGGELKVESAPNEGSTFSFELTFDTIGIDEETVEFKGLEVIEKPYFNGLVLVCEDNIVNQEVIRNHLANVGLEAVIAENGQVGLDIVTERMQNGEKPFDLIFMDIFMPVMDGIEASDKISALDTGVPIIALTANVMVSEIKKYKKHGMLEYLGKPFTTQELWRVLLNYITPVEKDSAVNNLYVAGEDELRRELCVKFAKENQNKYVEFTEAVNSGNINLAHRIAHTLKSSSGFIGMTRLQKTAAELESLLKNKTLPLPEEITSLFKSELETALNELEPLLNEELTKQENLMQLNDGQISELFEKLTNILEERSTECLDLLTEIRSVPGTEELVRHLECFDFEAAELTLGELKNKRGNNHD